MVFDNGVLDQCNPRFTLQPEEELQFAKSFMDHVADAVFWVEPNARFLYVNDAACCLAGYSREELLSMTMHDFDSGFSASVWSEYWRTIKQQGFLSFESLHQTKEGWSFPVEITFSYLESQGREYCCIFARNITKRKQAESNLQKANEALECRVQELLAELRDANAQLCREKASRQRTEAELEKSLSVLHATLESTAEGIAEAITGKRREELLAYPRKQAEVEIRQALKQEKELSELRARFISIVSHEFRTPLNNISLSTSSLRRYSHQWTESEKLEYLHGIEADIEQLNSLLDEVLLIGGAEAGKQKFSPKPLNLAQFCRDIVTKMQQSDSSNHAFSFVSQGDCSAACVDKKLLQPILTNLLENAIKYSPTNSQIDLELTCGDGDVIFQIKDRGIGIPAADQEQLFEPFHRGRNVGDIKGTGLGLSVVKKFVDLHGGLLSVASVVGVGTTFTVTLPLNKLLEIE